MCFLSYFFLEQYNNNASIPSLWTVPTSNDVVFIKKKMFHHPLNIFFSQCIPVLYSRKNNPPTSTHLLDPIGKCFSNFLPCFFCIHTQTLYNYGYKQQKNAPYWYIGSKTKLFFTSSEIASSIISSTTSNNLPPLLTCARSHDMTVCSVHQAIFDLGTLNTCLTCLYGAQLSLSHFMFWAHFQKENKNFLGLLSIES